jgi:hypothetical protein
MFKTFNKFKYLFNTFLKQYKIQSVHTTVIKEKWENYMDPYRMHNSVVYGF